MNTKIEKCKICGEPFYSFGGQEIPSNYDPTVCEDCNEKARKKAERQMNKPPTY